MAAMITPAGNYCQPKQNHNEYYVFKYFIYIINSCSRTLYWVSDQPMERTVTIRFSHIDGAGIVFYPRYFELLSELFAELPFAKTPFAMQTDFLRANYLGDEIQITFDGSHSRLVAPGRPVLRDISASLHTKPLPQKTLPQEESWSFTGSMNGTGHFSIRSLPPKERELDPSAHRPDRPAFQSDEIEIAPWATDCTGRLQVSRFFELVNVAVEQWFPRTLGMSFHELHTVRGSGIPTVTMRTHCRELPRAGDSVTMWIRPTKIGSKSLTYTTWLVREETCLLLNEQTIVFVKLIGRDFQTMPIPDGIRAALEKQYVAA